jgi:hypothetical protein
MTYEEARARAVEMGALKPQGLKENMAAGVMAHNGRSFAQTPLAQSRLEAWTQAIMRGEDPRG